MGYKMKKFIPALAVAIMMASPAWADGVTITVNVTTPEAAEGAISLALYNSEETFMEDAFAEQTAETAVEGATTLIFENVPTGIYGVSALHDQDGDGKLDTNFLGIPKEPIGFSNDAKGKFGPPDFDAVKFDVGADDVSLEINLHKITAP
jgi:uncharacterized protein (DUF2141 family)